MIGDAVGPGGTGSIRPHEQEGITCQIARFAVWFIHGKGTQVFE